MGVRVGAQGVGGQVINVSRRHKRLAVLGLLVAGLMTGCGPDRGLDALAADAYARPGRLVSLPDGRKLNLRCSGRGSPTVIQESGFGANSSAWSEVQPALSKITRVCAYDRAGYSFSDPGPQPRDGAAIARDLDNALEAAGVRGPYVVVGHSAGGLYGRLFAARRPDEVAGLVLLDPTVERRAPRPQGDGLDGPRRRVQRCLGAAETVPPPPREDPVWTGCLSPRAGPHDLAVGMKPDTWRAQLSELDTLFGRTSDQVFRIGPLLWDVPTYVITASESAEASPMLPIDKPISVWEAQHQQIAGASSRGFQTTVKSSHLVMVKRPDVVIAAVKEMVAAARAGRPPGPLPPSETESQPDAIAPFDDFKIPNPFDRPLTPDPAK